jgi:hypothetical protein
MPLSHGAAVRQAHRLFPCPVPVVNGVAAAGVPGTGYLSLDPAANRPILADGAHGPSCGRRLCGDTREAPWEWSQEARTLAETEGNTQINILSPEAASAL